MADSNATQENFLYQDAFFTVTPDYLRTPRKTYQMNRIEKISVSHGLLFFWVSLTIALLGFYAAFSELFTGFEAKLYLLLPVGILLALGRVATLYVTSKTLAEPALTWRASTIYDVREAIEEAIRISCTRQQRDVMAHHNDEDDDDVS